MKRQIERYWSKQSRIILRYNSTVRLQRLNGVKTASHQTPNLQVERKMKNAFVFKEKAINQSLTGNIFG